MTRMFSDETITGRFPAGTNDPKHIKFVSLVPVGQSNHQVIEFSPDPYESLFHIP